MTEAELAGMTALELADAIRRGLVSPSEAVAVALRRAEDLGPAVGAFVTLTPELALAQAEAAEEALAEGSAGDGVTFLGVPVAVKDLTRVAGVPMRMGTAALPPFTPEEDDGVVRRLRAAGVAVVGTTSTPEFGLPCYTEPDVGPTARTPWDLTRSAGGSSGGSAAAVAAGIVPFALGSDGGGSIRIPASACGLVGLKPSRGRISWGPLGVDRTGLASHGVLTRDVADTAAALDVLAGPWPGDQFVLPGPRATFLDATRRDPERLRIGLLTEPVIAADAPVHQACLDAAESTASLLEGLGHSVENAPVPFPAERWEAFRALWSVGALGIPVPPEAEERLVPLTRWLREVGRGVSGVGYAAAVTEMQMLAREVATAWAAFDVILTPTLAQPPAPVGSLREDSDPAADFDAQTRFTPWTSVWNLTGAPAVSLPVHWTRLCSADDGGPLLPIGVHLGGVRVGQEEVLLALAAQVETARPWGDFRPRIW